MKQRGEVRDPAKPVEYYGECISVLTAQNRGNLKRVPVRYSAVANNCLRMARAAYSAGESTEVCKKRLVEAANYQLTFFREGANGVLEGLPQTEQCLEMFSAAYFAGLANDLVDAFNMLTINEVEGWKTGLLEQYFSVLKGEGTLREADLEEVKRIKEYVPLPVLYRAIIDRDTAAFCQALEDFLTKGWGPSADRAARGDLRSPYPDYTGKWCFFAAALCAIMGCEPDISSKAMSYIPIDLVREFITE